MGAVAAAVGLVPFQTSVLSGGNYEAGSVLDIERGRARLSRLYRGVVHSARILSEAAARGGHRTKCLLVTFTLADGADWHPLMLSRCLKRLKAWLRNRGVAPRGVWVAELQRRGAVHYHLLLWVPLGVRVPFPDKRKWWSWGTTNIKVARSAVAYLASYAGKERQKQPDAFPSGCRLFGHFGLSASQRIVRAWWVCAEWVRGLRDEPVRFSRAVGGGVVLHDTGEIVRSPWRVLDCSGGVVRVVWVGW